MDGKQLLCKLRTEIRSGQLTQIPSSRYLSITTRLHRNTCAKVLKSLADEGLITIHQGTIPTIVNVANNPVDDAIDYLLNQGLSFESASEKLLKALEKRRAVAISSNSQNKELIQLELEGFKFSPDGLIISDQPQDCCEFLLQLSDIRDRVKEIKSQNSVRGIGIVSKSEAFRSHVLGALGNDQEIIAVEPIARLLNSMFNFCNQVICDYLIAEKLKAFAQENRRTIRIIPVPYLHEQTIKDLRGKLTDA